MSKYDGEYKLKNGMVMVFDYNAYCEYEEITEGGSIDADFASFATKGPSHRVIRHAAYAALKSRQPDITVIEAGNVIQAEPGAVAKAWALAHGFTEEEAEEQIAKVDDENFPKQPRKGKSNQ